MPGSERGNTTRTKAPALEQPSTIAASSRSKGMTLKNPQSIHTPSGIDRVQCASTTAIRWSANPILAKIDNKGIANNKGGNIYA